MSIPSNSESLIPLIPCTASTFILLSEGDITYVMPESPTTNIPEF